GPDEDKDGLGDIFESIIPGLNKSSADTDGDTLSDKFEYYVSLTNPAQADTDDDGLDDYQEYNVTRTNPLFADSDFDGLTDYEEVVLYMTNPFEIDSDGDGLDDRFEVKTAWDITTITPSVTEVMIGEVAYPNRTDPLNPDTDGDGLLDGEEGPRGIWYGAQFLFDAENEKIDTDGDGEPDTVVNRPAGNPREDAAPIIYNHGFTHPLDNDTDDDSYEQMWNGKISPRRKWLLLILHALILLVLTLMGILADRILILGFSVMIPQTIMLLNTTITSSTPMGTSCPYNPHPTLMMAIQMTMD
ncbi:MAG: hypothetical protein ACXACI_19875, partial [Candidatus Hodarchaeales archaeon]